MIQLRGLTLVSVALIALALRRDLLVRAIRTLDRRGGLASRRGEQAYAGASRIFSGLHRRVARDIASTVGNRPAAILDIGAGPGDLLVELLALVPAATLTGVEPSAESDGSMLGHIDLLSIGGAVGGHWPNIKNPVYKSIGIGVWRSSGRTRLVTDYYAP